MKDLCFIVASKELLEVSLQLDIHQNLYQFVQISGQGDGYLFMGVELRYM